jgi:hypothetical protein
MIQYSCDVCKRELDAEQDLRYVVRVDIYAAMDGAAYDDDNDSDHLEEMHDLLENIEDLEDAQIGEEVCQQLRFDLCSECRRRFIKNPLGRDLLTAKAVGFSKN